MLNIQTNNATFCALSKHIFKEWTHSYMLMKYTATVFFRCMLHGRFLYTVHLWKFKLAFDEQQQNRMLL